MIVIPAPELLVKTTALFAAADCPPPVAQRVAESLVGNNLAGHDSHGVMMAPPYVQRIKDGYLNPKGEITVVRESASTALLDCGFTFGQVAAVRLADETEDHVHGGGAAGAACRWRSTTVIAGLHGAR